jgi:DNA excision repair protein ERCC-4
MSTSSSSNIGAAAEQLSEAQTCSHFIAAVSAREMPDNNNVQLCILSAGFDVEGVVAHLLYQRMRQQRSRRVCCVVMPENLPPGSVTRLAKAIERHLLLRKEKEIKNPTSVEASVNAHQEAAASAAPPTTSLLSTAVVAIEEGTGTKERCAVFQRGAVVLLTSRSLCADLLHRRLAVELVGMAILLLPHSLLSGARVQEALAPQTAFCVELLLRGSKINSACLRNTERHTPPPIVVLSDAPMLMQRLVQRHQMGAERFVQQLHIGDVQLFPRFRLDFVRHFEELGRRDNPRGRPLDVDRVVAPVSPSLLALDGLLAKIALETLQELQRLEQQLQQQQQQQQLVEFSDFGSLIQPDIGYNAKSNGSPAARRAVAAADADEDVGAQRFLPRARFTATTLSGHLDYSGHPRSSGGSSSAVSGSDTGSAGVGGSYVRQGWRVAKDTKGIWFNGISDAAALSIDFSDLDSDLRTVVRRHESQWPYRMLVESLIDVRRLRRATRGTAFSFLLHLESVLEKRLPQRSVYGTGVRPPAALWTLSSHFNDVVTVATHRIGTVVYTAVTVPVPRPPATSTPSASPTVVVVDSSSSSSSDEEAMESESMTTTPASAAAVASPTIQVPQLVPNTEEQETDVEVAVRLVWSWCRTTLRRRALRSGAKSSHHVVSTNTTDPQHEGAVEVPPSSSSSTPSRFPTLLLLTFGAGAVARYTERLTHDRGTYQQLQLRRFMEAYQLKYGVQLQECHKPSGEDAAKEEEGAATGAMTGHQSSMSLFETDNPDDAYSDEENNEAAEAAMTEDGNDGDRERLTGVPRKLLQQQQRSSSGAGKRSGDPSFLSQADPSLLYGEGGSGASAFHQALLSQMPPVSTQQQQQSLPTPTPAENGKANDCGKISVTAAPASASPHSKELLTLTVERVRAGAVTLRPLLGVADSSSSSGVHDAMEGGPRVLVFDGSHLSATELTMLLEGTHEALAFSVPHCVAVPTTTATTSTELPDTKAAAAAEGACLVVDRVVLTRQQLSILRQLEMAQDELPVSCLRRLRVQLITTSLAEVDFKKAVQAERFAFESLAHTKATLTGTLLVDQSSLRQTEEALESGLQVARRRGMARKGSAVARVNGQWYRDSNAPTAMVAAPPCVVFDEREFRSTLPYDLYKRGVDLVPLTLTTADYVLSPDYAVERKSVLDYLQSVMSGRIQHQLAALTRKYTHPLCLIEFHRGIPFRMLQNRIYGRTAKLMANYPRVCFLWARSPAHAAGMLVTLKKSVATTNVDPSDPSLTGSSMDPTSAGEAGGLAASAAEREAAHYAARVLSRFPGVTPQNAPRVMRLCGSLIGLATISLASLETAMAAEDAARLYGFLHHPFHERVE